MDGAEEWVQIESAFGKADTVDLKAALKEIGEMVVGGAAIINDHVFFRHSVPLENLDMNEFERPFMLVDDDRRPAREPARPRRRSLARGPVVR